MASVNRAKISNQVRVLWPMLVDHKLDNLANREFNWQLCLLERQRNVAMFS